MARWQVSPSALCRGALGFAGNSACGTGARGDAAGAVGKRGRLAGQCAAPSLAVSPLTDSSVPFPGLLSDCRHYVFQINFFKKGAEMFSQSMDSFLSSVTDMAQR